MVVYFSKLRKSKQLLHYLLLSSYWIMTNSENVSMEPPLNLRGFFRWKTLEKRMDWVVKLLWKKLTSFLGFLAKSRHFCGCKAPYSSDMAPCDFWTFSKLKGTQFESWEDVIQSTMTLCTPFPKRHSTNVSNNGRAAGRIFYSLQETSLKRIWVSGLQ